MKTNASSWIARCVRPPKLPGKCLTLALAYAAAALPHAASAQSALTTPDHHQPPAMVHRIAVFGPDDRTLLPARLKSLEDQIGMIYERRSRSVCTAFCIDETTVATAAHCLYRTRGERPLPLSTIAFRLASMGKRSPGVRIAGATNGAAAQNVMTGTMDLSTSPPIEASRDWALLRLATPVCRKGGLPLVRHTPAELSASQEARPIYQVGFHRDFGNWSLAYSPPCTVRRLGAREGGRVIAGDFADPSALILHTCDTGGASSGSPLFVDGPRGPEVVGINVGTYLQSHVLTQAGEVLHRYRSDAVANTGVSTLAFMDQKDAFTRAEVVATRDGLMQIQRALTAAGHYRGPIDGRYGPKLRAAISAFEAAERRTSTGLASTELLLRLQAVVANQGGTGTYEPTSDRLETGNVPRPRPEQP